jgi:hypothetical protein
MVKEQRIFITCHNFGGSGVTWTLLYNELYDGPLENYNNKGGWSIKYVDVC